MLLSKLLPREGKFFDSASRHVAHVVDAARAFSQLIVNYADQDQREQFAGRINAAEEAANVLMHEFKLALHKTFITPIDRGQLYRLITIMDRVVDQLRDAAAALALYDFQHLTPDAMRLSEIALLCCERLEETVHLLPHLPRYGDGQRVLDLTRQIAALEAQSDRVMHEAVGRLLREEPDVRELIKLKTMYEQVEAVADRCAELARVLESIALDHA